MYTYLLSCFCRTKHNNFTNADLADIQIMKNQLYNHKVCRFNYTTYDMRRDQDSINPNTRSDVMLLSEDTNHCYWYARVVFIFHAFVRYQHSNPQRIDLLFVRWYTLDLDHEAGFTAKRLYRVGFVDGQESDPFDFINPADVIRAVHLIPAFAFGKTDRLLSASAARRENEEGTDYRYYYVNM